MELLVKKAKNYFIAGEIGFRIGNFDVASTNYFKSLAAVNDFVLAKKGLYAKDHNERFFMLKENESFLYRITSSLFLTYRRAYSKEIKKDETLLLKERLKEVFEYAKIEVPTDAEINRDVKKALKK